MKRIAITAAVLLAGQAGPCWAQGGSAEVQQLLKGAANPADFADVSSGGVVSLKHKPSGVVWTFDGDPQSASLHSSAAGVMCNSATPYELDALEVFLAPNTSESDIEGAIQRALGSVQDLRPISGFEIVRSHSPGAPLHMTRRFAGTMRGSTPVVARVAWVQVGDWFIFQRVIAGLDAAGTIDAEAERKLVAAIDQAVANQPKSGKPKGR